LEKSSAQREISPLEDVCVSTAMSHRSFENVGSEVARTRGIRRNPKSGFKPGEIEIPKCNATDRLKC
jgi:hypothetical protein